jgi:D-beta-D-heptose 7-phosphate kinase/D-beta-D-heptose 1-phosphate adenosyltransferase
MTPPLPTSKWLSWEELFARHGRPRNHGVVFTNGCFDVLHRGHVEYLHAARALGDVLVVGLNSDESVRRLKGSSRPVNTADDRAWVLGGLAAVDAIVVFEQDTPMDLIEGLLPDVLIKGGDYRADQVIGASSVQKAGGRVVIAPLAPGRSTTAILRRKHEQ